MSKPLELKVRREDVDTFVASVSTKFNTMEEAVAWSEALAKKAQETNVEWSSKAETVEPEYVPTASENEAPTASESVV